MEKTRFVLIHIILVFWKPMLQYLRPKCKTINDFELIKAQFIKAGFVRTISDFDKEIKVLYNSHYFKSNPEAVKYIENNQMPYKKLWANCYRNFQHNRMQNNRYLNGQEINCCGPTQYPIT